METTIQFVKGSHRWGRWFCPRKFATNKNYLQETDYTGHIFEDIPDIDGNISDYEILKLDVQVRQDAET